MFWFRENVRYKSEQLSENIKINNYKNVKKFNVALSNIKSRILMWVPDKNKTGGYSIYNEKDIAQNSAIIFPYNPPVSSPS